MVLKLDGTINGNIVKPAVKIIEALVKLELTNAIKSFDSLIQKNVTTGNTTLPIGANHIQV